MNILFDALATVIFFSEKTNKFPICGATKRWSLMLDGKYIAIMEVKLGKELIIEKDKYKEVLSFVISSVHLDNGIIYDVMDTLIKIGEVTFTDFEVNSIMSN